jgi:hypothetical protein
MVSNQEVGIRIVGLSDNNIITENLVSGSEGEFGSGIELNWMSNNNMVFRNIVLNSILGIGLYRVCNNTVFHNNFINNSVQSYIYNSNDTVWVNGWIGNYWSDYEGIDTDGDGVGDIPYIIDEQNSDYYPLMNPFWSLGDIDHDFDVDIFDVVKVAGLYGSTMSDSYWVPRCDIVEPFGVINIFDLVMIASLYGEEYTPCIIGSVPELEKERRGLWLC